jgi:hypothetical protein
MASNAFSNSGCVVNKANAAVLVDETGNQVFGLQSAAAGVDLRKFVGKRAAVTGTVSNSGNAQAANQIVNVLTISAATGGECAQVAAKVGATTTAAGLAAGAVANAGVSTVTATPGAPSAGIVPAVIAGIVIAVSAGAVVGGLAAAGTFSSTSP